MYPGAVLGGRYRLEDLLEEVEGARFWRATDTVLARNVAVHVLDATDSRVEPLLEAARLSATITDPHLLRVLDADVRDGVAWVINEWGRGQSLDVIVSRQTLPPDRAAWLVREVASAVAVAHAQGVAHGRLAPENVMVTDSGTVRLIGFAIDAALRPDRLRSGSYPGVDGLQADVLDLAGLLYTGLVARWPGASWSAVPAAPRDARGPLRPRQVRAGVPRPLDAICDRVLGRSAPGRTAHQLAAVLTEYLGELATADPALLPEIDASLDDLAGAMGGASSAEPEPAPAEPEPDEPEPTALIGREELGPDSVPAPIGPSAEEAIDDDVLWETAAGPDAEGSELSRPDADSTATGASAPDPLSDPDATEIARFGDRPGTGPEDDPDWHQPSSEPAPPAPALEPVPERPLFAPAGTRRTPKAPPPRSATADWAAVPLAAPAQITPRPENNEEVGWAFGEDPEVEQDDWEERTSRHWLRVPLMLALVAVVAVAAALYFTLGNGPGSLRSARGDPPSTPTATPVVGGSTLKIATVTDFDPFGNLEENPKQAANATDGDPKTVWQTLVYRGRPTLGGLKPGVGLVLDLGSIQAVESVTVDLVGKPTSLELYAAPTSANAPSSSDGPAALDGLQRIAEKSNAGERVVLRAADRVRTRYLVVWLTSLPPVTGGFRGQLAEVVVHS